VDHGAQIFFGIRAADFFDIGWTGEVEELKFGAIGRFGGAGEPQGCPTRF